MVVHTELSDDHRVSQVRVSVRFEDGHAVDLHPINWQAKVSGAPLDLGQSRSRGRPHLRPPGTGQFSSPMSLSQMTCRRRRSHRADQRFCAYELRKMTYR